MQHVTRDDGLRDAHLRLVARTIGVPSPILGGLVESTPPSRAAHLSNLDRAEVFNAEVLRFLTRL
jgi:hypothetical protein